jgi:hypothetical protein
MDAELRAKGSRQEESPDNAEVSAVALAYLRRGWSVVPIRPRSKLPLIAWEEYQYRRADESEVVDWFRRWPNGNVGIVTGSISHLAVLDIDPRHGGTDSVAFLERTNGPLPATIEAETGGGGRHLYFKTTVPLRSRAGLAAGIDIRAEGGLVVAPPSIHPSGKRYAWRAGHGPTEVEPALLPQWLESLASQASEGRGHPVQYWRNLLRAGVAEGVRNSTIASLAGHLLWRGVDPQVVIELLLCWNRVRCRPPLEDEEVVRVASSIIHLHRAHDAHENASH